MIREMQGTALHAASIVTHHRSLLIDHKNDGWQRQGRLSLPILFRSNGGCKLPSLEGILGAEAQVSLVERLRLGESLCLLEKPTRQYIVQ